MDIVKAIIPLGGLATRFLPLSKVLPKEFWPLVEKPLLQYAVEELKNSGVTDIVFVVNTLNKDRIGQYFASSPSLEKALEEQKREELLESLRKVEKLSQGLSFSFVAQTKPQGDGNAVLLAKKYIGEDPCIVLYPDDVIVSDVPVALQLAKTFKTAQKPVLGLVALAQERLTAYGVVGAEKIATRLYKVKKLVEKPATPEAAPSNLVSVGRRILTSEVFDYLKRAKPNKKGEVVLGEVLGEMAKDGKILYGYELEGKWLECGEIKSWLYSFVRTTLLHPAYGKDIQKLLRSEKII
ncbi:MAG: UTP--glucose-1-phosphate uridylyltransferase [Candidatus Wildermuthbacteria bacterium]|nr:UTP--glucose-1-phosphate uridylyltransferase [Candidatus Wildermuthbacteria bacterium]